MGFPLQRQHGGRAPARPPCLGVKAFGAGILVLLLAQATPAVGATSASLRAASTVRSATWSLVALPQGAVPSTGPLVINWYSIKGVPYAYVDLASTGSIPVAGGSFTVSTVGNNGGKKNPTITLEACIGASWDASTNTCPGTTLSLGSTVAGTLSSSFNLGAGARLSMRVTSSGNPGADYTTTISTSVSRSQARAATVTNG